MNFVLIKIGQKLCDFGLWVLSLGPKDEEDKILERELIDHWRELEKKRLA